MTLIGFLRGERCNIYSRPGPAGYRALVTSADPKPPRKKARRLAPDLWVSLRPNGIGLQKPNHFGEMARTVWENRHAPRYAWRILSQGVCDGCALGVAGFHDWTIDGIHLCTTRLNLLRLNTMRRARPACDSADVEALRSLVRRGAARPRPTSLPHAPAARRARLHAAVVGGGAGPRRGSRIRAARAKDAADGGDRLGFFLTARGITNEVYYVAQKVARALGTNSVDNAARICHAPSTNALKDGAGGGGDHRLVHRRHRVGPHRAVRRGCRERPAGVHEVPVHGAQARRPHRGREPDARAGARALLGALEPRERASSGRRWRPSSSRSRRAATSRS